MCAATHQSKTKPDLATNWCFHLNYLSAQATPTPCSRFAAQSTSHVVVIALCFTAPDIKVQRGSCGECYVAIQKFPQCRRSKSECTLPSGTATVVQSLRLARRQACTRQTVLCRARRMSMLIACDMGM
jgi:hypothetical protein